MFEAIFLMLLPAAFLFLGGCWYEAFGQYIDLYPDANKPAPTPVPVPVLRMYTAEEWRKITAEKNGWDIS
jgi:hypothetical protein